MRARGGRILEEGRFDDDGKNVFENNTFEFIGKKRRATESAEHAGGERNERAVGSVRLRVRRVQRGHRKDEKLGTDH